MRKTPQHFRDQIDSLGIPRRDTVGLRVTNRAPAGFNTVDDYFVCNGKKYARDDYAGHRTVGLYVKVGGYFSRKGDVHMVRNTGVESLVHEIGHHVTLTLNGQSANEKQLNLVVRHLARENLIDMRYGLRQYSFTNWKELLADCYRVRYTGTRKQWANLVNFFGAYDVNLVAATAA